MQGYISLHRKIMGNSLWNEKPFDRARAWIDLIMLANYKEGFIRVRGVNVPLKRGQLGYSERTLSNRWGWSRGKVRRFFSELEAMGMVEPQKNNVTSLFTIINYDDHQKVVPQTDHRIATNINDVDTRTYNSETSFLDENRSTTKPQKTVPQNEPQNYAISSFYERDYNFDSTTNGTTDGTTESQKTVPQADPNNNNKINKNNKVVVVGNAALGLPDNFIFKIAELWNQGNVKKMDVTNPLTNNRIFENRVKYILENSVLTYSDILFAIKNYHKARAIENTQAYKHTLLNFLRVDLLEKYSAGFDLDNYRARNFNNDLTFGSKNIKQTKNLIKDAVKNA